MRPGDAVSGAEGVASMDAMTIGRALAARRRDTGLDPEAAAVRLGVTRSTYTAYEHGSRRPSVATLRAVADFLDVTTDVVLELYGVTCVEQARRVLQPDVVDNASTASSSGTRAAHRHDVTVIERVYFDPGVTNGDHRVEAPAQLGAASHATVARTGEGGDAATDQGRADAMTHASVVAVEAKGAKKRHEREGAGHKRKGKKRDARTVKAKGAKSQKKRA